MEFIRLSETSMGMEDLDTNHREGSANGHGVQLVGYSALDEEKVNRALEPIYSI
jgi:hypothetical protein